MSSAGTIMAMIISLKNNARPRRKKIFDMFDLYLNTTVQPIKGLKSNPLTKEEILEIKMESDRAYRITIYKRILALALSILLLGGIVWLVSYAYNSDLWYTLFQPYK